MTSISAPRFVAAMLLAAVSAVSAAAPATEAPVVRSAGSGAWSAPATWEVGRIPKAGDRVLVRKGHAILYDVDSAEVLRAVQVAGSLEFAADRDTRLEVGLLKVGPGQKVDEEGFDCHAAAAPAPNAPPPGAEPALFVGRPGRPIPAGKHAIIRLHHLAGMNPESCPAVVACGGRMEFHGAPIPHTWAKLSRPVRAGDSTVWIAESPEGWRVGDRIIVTATQRRREKPVGERFQGAQTEEAVLEAAGPRPPKAGANPRNLPYAGGEANNQGFSLHLAGKLAYDHAGGGEYNGEVANLSRNIIIESADPAGVRGHVLYHSGSAGSVGYAEFRHLGKRDVLGRYTLHFHLAGDTMRGSSVVGASFHDSHNRWLTIHGTNYLVVRDCVGYRSVGHGFFLEDGTECYNVLDHNLAVLATEGKPLPKQILPFDPNAGAGFWWANCRNTFTDNVAADCDGYGFRFDARREGGFDPVQAIAGPDGVRKPADIRSLPFIRFEGNEAHALRAFGLNLRGMDKHDETKPWYNLINQDFAREARESSPDRTHPFWIRRFRCWDTIWAFHCGTPGVFVDGFDAYDCQYGFFRPVIDRHAWHNITMRQIANRDLHMPFTVGIPDGDGPAVREHFAAVIGFADDFPPVSVITGCYREGDEVIVRGTTSDSSDIRKVLVNGRPARSLRRSFAEWEAILFAPAGTPLTVTAKAEDAQGNIEVNPHTVTVRHYTSRGHE